MTSQSILIEQLCQQWLHSHEENDATEMVFRPRSYEFPPSRGRQGLEFRADGTVIESEPGPADKPVRMINRWKVPKQLTIVIVSEDAGVPRKSFRVVELSAEVLKLQRIL